MTTGEGPLTPYAQLGYELIPLHPWDHKVDGKERGKSPRDREWTQVQYTYEQVLDWKAAGGNVGVRLRETDLVLDWDPRNAVPEDGDVLARFQADVGIDLRDYPCVLTGSGGFHFYGLREAFPIFNKRKDVYGHGLEFKSFGRQVVAAGSRHPNGNVYAWTDWSTPLAEAPRVPQALADLVRRPVRERKPGSDARIPTQQVAMCVDQLNPEAYRDHDDWFELMQSVHYASGADDDVKEAFVKWSTEDPLYSGDAEVIGTRWDSLDEHFEGGVGVGTLFKHVGDAGGTPFLPAAMVFQPVEVEVVVIASGEERPVYEPIFARGNDKLPKASYGNALEGLKGLDLQLTRDRFKHESYLGNGASIGRPSGAQISDEVVLAVKYFLWLRYALQARTGDLYEGISAVAAENSYDSLVDHLDALTWDEEPRVAAWIARYCGAEPTPYVRAVGRITLMGMVARAYQPGCMYQSMPIFEGPQGIGKSTMLKILAGSPARMKEGLHSIGDKDSVIELAGKWVVEIADLAAFRRTETEVLKDFVSRDVDTVREPYGRKAVDRPRRCVLVGTTNETGYLSDSTGNRRYLPVWIDRVDLSALLRDRDQLVAEAVSIWKNDPTPEALQMPPVLYATAAAEQDQRRIEDPWEDLVAAWLGKIDETVVTTSQVVRDGLQRLAPTHGHTGDTRRISKVMQRLGWRKCKVTDGEGHRVNGYRYDG